MRKIRPGQLWMYESFSDPFMNLNFILSVNDDSVNVIIHYVHGHGKFDNTHEFRTIPKHEIKGYFNTSQDNVFTLLEDVP